jgi:hypothetical protein
MKTPSKDWYLYDNEWHHIVSIYDGHSKKETTYLDGKKIKEKR